MDIEKSGRKLRQILEDVLEGKLEVPDKPDTVEKLRTLYGQKPYRCRQQACAMSLAEGFETSIQRDQHENGHDISYKCSEENCFYKDVGFSSKVKLQRHKRGSHNTASVSRPRIKALEVLLGIFLHCLTRLFNPTVGTGVRPQGDSDETKTSHRTERR